MLIKGALYVCNTSGGKDSQAMAIYLKSLIPEEQLVFIHAHLPGVEWDGVIEHIKNTIGDSELHVVQAGKTFFGMVEHRGMWPSPKYRQCTSDLKRGPIEKKIKEICNKRGFKVVVNCMGLRAEESPNRAKKEVFKHNHANSNSKRTWYDWLPIHHKTKAEVFQDIEKAGQKPHWAYSKGMSRLSCVFCIMSSDSDLRIAAEHNPDVAKEYMAREESTGQTFFMPTKKYGKRTLLQILNDKK